MGKYVWKSGDREEPLRLVSANDLNLVLNEWERVGDFNLSVRAVRAMIERVPTVDAVPVVRCKDCKNLCKVENFTWLAGACEITHNKVTADFFLRLWPAEGR